MHTLYFIQHSAETFKSCLMKYQVSRKVIWPGINMAYIATEVL